MPYKITDAELQSMISDELVEKALRAADPAWLSVSREHAPAWRARMRRALEAAAPAIRAEGKREGLEEAAKVVDAQGNKPGLIAWSDTFSDRALRRGWIVGANHFAAAIRAMKEPA